MSIFEELADFIGNMRVEREIAYKGQTHAFWFRELSADDALEFFQQFGAEPKKKTKEEEAASKEQRNRILARIVCQEDGSDAMTVKEAGKLPLELANKLNKVCLEVNGLGADAEKEAKND